MTRIIAKLELISYTLFERIIKDFKKCFDEMNKKYYINSNKIIKQMSKTLMQIMNLEIDFF